MSKFIIFSFLVLAAVVASADADSVSACLYPVNARLFKLERSDGEPLKLVRDEEDPRVLTGLDGWHGETDDKNAMIVRLGTDGTPVEGYMFKRGRLVRHMKNGCESPVSSASIPRSASSYAELWPNEVSEEEIRTQNIWRNSNRMTFGFVNPNYAAAFVGSFGALFLLLASRRGLLLRLMGGLGFAASGVAVLLTGSRGGLLAFVFSAAFYLAFLCRRWMTWKRVIFAVVLCSIALGSLLALRVGDRFTRQLFAVDESNSIRLELLAAAPKMMVDAPDGWGWGQGGIAFTNWYQDAGRFRMLRGMINSHLNILIETGWIGRFLYLYIWAWLLLTSFRDAVRGKNPAPFSAFAFLGVSASFNAVMSSPASWIVPVFALCMHISRHLPRHGRLCLKCGIVALVPAVLLLAGFAVVGWCAPRTSPSVRGGQDVVFVNGDNPKVWCVEDGYVLDGGYLGLMGREVRSACQDCRCPAVAFTRQIGRLPAGVEKAVVVGKCCADYVASWADGRISALPRELIFLSPSIADADIPEAFRTDSRVKIVRGEFARQMVGSKTGDRESKTVAASLVYLPNWLSFL